MHPRFYSFGALGSLQFSLEHSLAEIQHYDAFVERTLGSILSLPTHGGGLLGVGNPIKGGVLILLTSIHSGGNQW